MATRTSSKPKGTGGARPRAEARGRRRNTPFDILGGTVWDERVGPFVAIVLVALAGLVFHSFWGHPPAVYLVSPVVVALGIGGYALVYAQSHGRRQLFRHHAALSCSMAVISLGLTTAFGFDVSIVNDTTVYVSTWLQVFVFCGLFLAASWIPPTFGAVSGYGTDEHVPDSDNPFEAIIKGAKVNVKLLEDNGPRKTWKVSHPGLLSKTVGDLGDLISSMAQLPVNGWRSQVDPDDTSITIVNTVSEDQLRRAIEYPGPSAPGQSCVVPSRVGVREDASALEIVRPGDPKMSRPASSVLVAGMTGSGKTEGVLCEVAELVTRIDVVIWWIDVRKGEQTVPDFRPAIDWYAGTDQEASAMASAFAPVIKERSAMLGALGYREWVPECWTKYGIPFIVAHLEEATTTLERLGTAFTRGAEAVRSAGMSLSNSLQRPSATNIPTDLRSQFGIAWCFGMKEDIDASMILSDITMEAGARPEAWKNKRPGYNILEANHVDETTWSMPGRTFKMKPVQLASVTAEYSRRMAAVDPRTAGAAGPAYANRERVSFEVWLDEAAERHGRKVRQAANRGTEALETAPSPVPAQRPEWSGVGVAEALAPVVPLRESDGEITDEEIMREMGIDAELLKDLPSEDELDEELPPAREFAVGPQPEPGDREYTSKERAEAFVQLLADAYDAGERELAVAEITRRFSALPEGGVTPNWTYWRLKKIEDVTGQVAVVVDAEGEPADPRRYTLGAGLSRVNPPDPATDPDSPAHWSPADF